MSGRRPLQLAQQERLPLGLAPVLVGAEPELARDGRQRLGVARRVLPQIEPHQRGAERRDAPQQIAQPSAGQERCRPVCDERAVAQAERFGEVLRALDDRDTVAIGVPVEPVLRWRAACADRRVAQRRAAARDTARRRRPTRARSSSLASLIDSS